MKNEKINIHKLPKILRGFAEIRILWELQKEPMHGYKLFKCIFPQQVDIQPSRIYPLLKSLEKDNLIKSKVKKIRKRKRVEYSVTKKGKKYLISFRSQLSKKTKEFLRYLSK